MRRATYVIVFSLPFLFIPMVVFNSSLVREGSYIALGHDTIWFINLLLHMYPHYEENIPENDGSVFNLAAGRGRPATTSACETQK